MARLETGSSTATSQAAKSANAPALILFKRFQRLEVRAQIIACAEAGFSMGGCAWSCACSRSTAQLWWRRWRQQTGPEKELTDPDRSGRPAIITEATQLKVIAFYCQKQPLPGINRWTLSTAADYLKEHPELIDAPVSRASIGRILKGHGIKPHLTEYFLQITDPDFFTKMQPIIELNCNPPEHLFYFDECPGLQALRRVDAELPPGKKVIRKRGFDYQRNGTCDVMAFLEAHTGEVFARCTDDHKTATLIEVFKQHVSTQPDDAELHYVMDNLSPHFNEDFCRTVATLSGEIYPAEGMDTGKERREWLQKSGKRITIYFTPFHGSWLNLIEVWFGILRRHCLNEMDFPSVDLLSEWIEQFIETWNGQMAHPFNWTYTGEGLHGKALRRFSRWLSLESDDVSCSFLTKQLRLTVNLIEKFADRVGLNDWQYFDEVISQKTEYIERVIGSEEKPKVRTNGASAFAQLLEVLPKLPAIPQS